MTNSFGRLAVFNAYFTRTRWNGGLLSTFLAALCWLVYFFFIARGVRNFTGEITNLYSADCPVVKIDHGDLRMEGTIPFSNQNQHQVLALFDTTGQLKKIPETAAVGSFLITDQSIVFRSSVNDHSVNIQDIKINRLTLSHDKLRSFFDQNQSKFLLILALGGFLIFWFGTFLLLLIGSLLMLGIDYLAGGEKNGTVIFNLAALILVPIYLFWSFHRILDWGMRHLPSRIFMLYLLAIIITTILTRKKLNDPGF
jgi:hypothetical protein